MFRGSRPQQSRAAAGGIRPALLTVPQRGEGVASQLPARPVTAQYRVSAGRLSPDHWTRDDLSQGGGGRILGELCHFVDCLTFLVGIADLIDPRGGPPGPRRAGSGRRRRPRHTRVREPIGGHDHLLRNGERRESKGAAERHSRGGSHRSAGRLPAAGTPHSAGRRADERKHKTQDKGHRLAKLVCCSTPSAPAAQAPSRWTSWRTSARPRSRWSSRCVRARRCRCAAWFRLRLRKRCGASDMCGIVGILSERERGSMARC